LLKPIRSNKILNPNFLYFLFILLFVEHTSKFLPKNVILLYKIISLLKVGIQNEF